MARVRAHLENEEQERVLILEVESDDEYRVNWFFNAPNGGIYLIAEAKPGEPPIDTELTAVWLEGPHPVTLLGGHS
jgi:hypothetical protein